VPAPDNAGVIAAMRVAYDQGDYPLAQRNAQRLRALGLPEGATMLGLLTQEGRFGPVNYDEAAELYGEAIKKDLAEAMRRLGLLHLGRMWPRADPKTGLGRLSQAATLGDAIAVYEQGRLYRAGRHVTKDPRQAMELFGKAGAAGVADANAEMGEMYASGDAVPRDIAKARELIGKALAAGSVRGMFAKATMVYSGLERPQTIVAAAAYDPASAAEYVQARKMLQEAAAKGEPMAMLMLANMSMEGRGGRIDPDGAYRWLQTLQRTSQEDAALASAAKFMAQQLALAIGQTRAAEIDREMEKAATKR
jgi:TPR repeat protein